MKRIVKLLLLVTLFISLGCSGNSKGVSPVDSMSGGYEIAIPKYTKIDKIHDVIMKAGEKSGWKMTDFKKTSVVGEKIVGDKGASVLVSFGTEDIIIMQDNSTLGADYDDSISELMDAINKELNAHETH